MEEKLLNEVELLEEEDVVSYDEEGSKNGILLGTFIGLGVSALTAVAYKKVYKPGKVKVMEWIQKRKESKSEDSNKYN